MFLMDVLLSASQTRKILPREVFSKLSKKSYALLRRMMSRLLCGLLLHVILGVLGSMSTPPSVSLLVTGHFPAANPNGILAVLRVQKNWSARAHHEAFRLRTAGDPHAALRSEAEPFDAWAARTSGLGGAR